MSEDRTTEFLSLARTLPGADRRTPRGAAGLGVSSYSTTGGSATAESSQNGGSGGGGATKAVSSQELRNFHKTAAEISRDIAGTSALLSELTRLVKQKSMFEEADGDSAKINQLVVRIKTTIENLNARLDDAGHTIASQKRRLNSQASQQAFNLVDGLKTEFAQAASGFKKVLQQRTDNMRETDLLQKNVYGWGGNADDGDNENAVMPNITSLALPPVYGNSNSGLGLAAPNSFPTLDLTSSMMSAGEASGPTTLGGAGSGGVGSAPTSSALPRPHGITDSALRNRRGPGGDGGAMYNYHRTHSAPPLTPLDIQRAEQESGLSSQMQLIPDQSYLQERANAMSQVETNIVELGTIFNKLAVMVSEHQEMVQRVEDNVQDANANINLSLGVLTDTLTSLRTNRQLALRVFSILVAFIVFFIVFFA